MMPTDTPADGSDDEMTLDDRSAGGNANPITIHKQSGATLNDIGDMIDDVCRAYNRDVSKRLNVGSTRETTENVSPQEIKEKMGRLVQKAKMVTPSVSASSALPCS